MIETTGLYALTGGAVIFSPASIVEVKRTVAERAHMKVVLRTLGRDASVADWLTRLFQTIICLSARWWRRYSDGSQRARYCPRAIDAIAAQLLLDGQHRERLRSTKGLVDVGEAIIVDIEKVTAILRLEQGPGQCIEAL